MQSHDLAKALLAEPDMPVRLYTDHGQTSSLAFNATISIYSESEEVCFPVEQREDFNDGEAFTDEITVVEIYGE